VELAGGNFLCQWLGGVGEEGADRPGRFGEEGGNIEGFLFVLGLGLDLLGICAG